MGLSQVYGSFRRFLLFKERGLWSAYSQVGGAQPRPGGRAGPRRSPGPPLPHGGHLQLPQGAGVLQRLSGRPALLVHGSFPSVSVTEKLCLWSVTARRKEAGGSGPGAQGPGLRPGSGCRPAAAPGRALRRGLCALPVAAVTNHHRLRGLTRRPSMIPYFWRSEVWNGDHRAEIKVSRLTSSWKILGRNCFLASSSA